MTDLPAGFIGPTAICVRGPSRSGKTAVCERLIVAFEARGLRVAYLKRTHHPLDLPEKASGRVWQRRPSAMVIRDPERLQVTTPAPEPAVQDLLAALPDGIDLALVETHTPEPFPALVSDTIDPAPDEVVLGRWTLPTVDAAATAAVDAIIPLLPVDRQLDHALRAAMRVHGSHACAGLVLGTRLALQGARALGVDVPDSSKRLLVTVETDRCAVDAIQAVTGCRPGKRTLRLLDYGKLAATFFDQWAGRGVRVAVRGDLRERAADFPGPEDRHDRQRLAYLQLAPADLFTVSPTAPEPSQFDLPGPPRRRVLCGLCGEEVSDGREIVTEAGTRCRPCAAAAAP
ncbi:MAG: molybdopterin-guanine dinucleotide biosynthesis protein MobB [Dehalococcoidia bacterium]|nr:molybdopterin-guanine dinucleotide biosynthesis protein MobB [Dehalococcoidia bacterium]